jgi:hypothetical protein
VSAPEMVGVIEENMELSIFLFILGTSLNVACGVDRFIDLQVQNITG